MDQSENSNDNITVQSEIRSTKPFLTKKKDFKPETINLKMTSNLEEIAKNVTN